MQATREVKMVEKLPPDRDQAPDQTLNPMEREPPTQESREKVPAERPVRKDGEISWEEYFRSQEDLPPEWVDG